MRDWLTEDIGSRPLGLARVVVGSATLLTLAITAPVLIGLTGDEVLLTPFLAWLPAPSLPLVLGIILLWAVTATSFMIGWRVPVTGSMLAGVLAFTVALDQQTYSNHLYLLTWLVALLTLAGAGAGLNYRRMDRPVVRWPTLLLMAQLSIVYGFSGLSKIHEGFISGQVLAGALRNGVIAVPDALLVPRVMSVLAAVVIVTETALALLTWSPLFRPIVFVLGLALHLSIALTMSATGQLVVFGIAMLSLYPLFLSGDRLQVSWNPDCAHCRKIVERSRRRDLLRVLDFHEIGKAGEISLSHRGRVTRGAAAHTRILEHVVPWLWLAPVLRLPGLSRLHRVRHGGLHESAAQG